MTTAHALSSYIPRLVRRQLASAFFDDKPRLVVENAALLLGDIKGSTGIVERVGKQGSLALETLTQNLDELYSDFIEVVYAFGGDVLYIAGDAFLCYWPVDNNRDLDAVTSLAASAGLKIQQKLRGRTTGFGDELIFRIGLGAGLLNRAFVGGHADRWELVLSGDVFDQVSEQEKCATPGRVLVSPQAWILLREQFPGQQKSQGSVELVAGQEVPESKAVSASDWSVDLLDSQLLPFVPAAVSQRRIAASHSWLSEFRRVTVFMADLPGMGLSSELDLYKMHQSVRAFQKVITRYEGNIKVDVDDKGIMLLAIFGLPPMAHEDDASRAVHAGWDLLAELEVLDVSCGIGISTGRALCAPLGSDQRREYMVRGDVINRAARLMHITHSELICDEATHSSTREEIDYESLPQHMLKGLSETVEVKRPIGKRRAEVRKHREIIGREKELAFLDVHLLQFMQEDIRGTVVIEGEAGLGKTSLVDAFAQRASNQGARVLRAQAMVIQRSSPLHAWRGIFRDLFGLTEGLDNITRIERVMERMTRYPALEALTPLLSNVIDLDIPDNTTTSHMSGDVRAENAIKLLYALLQELMSTAPCTLIVEDAQWFDSLSWDLLVALVNSNDSGCIVVATRPAESNVPDWADLNTVQSLKLKGFDLLQTSQLIERRIGVSRVPEDLVNIVHARSGGNPFFTEQIVHAMIDDGVIHSEQGVCLVHDIEEFAIPANVEGMVLSRIDRLPEEQLLLIKMASVVGPVFEVEAVVHTMPAEFSEDSAINGFASLAQAGFIDDCKSDTGQHYQFRHIITRDVTYATLAQGQRVSGHIAYARWLESSAGLGSGSFALLAHHWGAAEEHEQSLKFMEKASFHALRDGSFPEALHFFEKMDALAEILALDKSSVRAASWLKGKGTAHYFLGHMDLSRENIEPAVTILDRALPASRIANLLGLLGGIVSQLLYQTWYKGKPRSALAGKKEKEVYDQAVDCYKILGQLYFLEGETAERLIYLSLRGLNLGERAGPSTALACILTNMSFTASLAGLDGPSDWYAKRAVAMTQEAGQKGAAAYVWHIDALRHAQHGDWKTALDANEKAHSLILELGDFTLATEAAAIRAALSLCSGDIKTATIAVSSARKAAQDDGNEQYLCWALLDEAEIALAKDQLNVAEKFMERAFEIATEDSDLSSTLDKQRALATIRFRQQRNEEAMEAADVICQIITSNPPTSYYFLDFFASAVEVYVRMFIQSPNDRYLRKKTRAELKRLGRLSKTFWNVRARYWLLKGLTDFALGRKPMAALQKSVETAESMGANYDEARALSAIARIDPTASEAREKATSLFGSLGRIQDIVALEAGSDRQ